MNNVFLKFNINIIFYNGVNIVIEILGRVIEKKI